VGSKKQTQKKKNSSKDRKPLGRVRQNAKPLVQKKNRAARKKSTEHTPSSIQELRRAAFECADVLEKQPEFQKKLFQQINENAEFRELIITSTIRKLLS